MPSDVFQLACIFQNRRPLEGDIAISVTQNSIIGHTGKSLGGVHTGHILALKTGTEKVCLHVPMYSC